MSKRNYSSLHINISKNLSNKLNQATHNYGLSKGEIVRQALSQELNTLKGQPTNKPLNNDKEVLKQLHTFYNGDLLNSLPIDKRLNQHRVVEIANKIAKSNIPLTMSNAYYARIDRYSLRILIICLFVLKPYIKKYLKQHVGEKEAKAIKFNDSAEHTVRHLSDKYESRRNHYHLPKSADIKVYKINNQASEKMKDAMINQLLIRNFSEPRSQMAWIFSIKNESDSFLDVDKYKLLHICRIINKRKNYTYLEDKLIQYNLKSSIGFDLSYDLIGHLATYVPSAYIQSMHLYWTPIAKGILHHKL